ncbi:hypothetical protein [Rhizobium sp. ZPR3]|uniref:Cell division protein FtsX n=2 Tax=unclassified Rhizobium TaxID=2613769 RepID=A0AAU7SCF7_9HYPH
MKRIGPKNVRGFQPIFLCILFCLMAGQVTFAEEQALNGIAKLQAQKEFATALSKQTNEEASQEGWLSWSVGLLKEAVPGATWVRGNTVVNGAYGGSILPGKQLLLQVIYLGSLPTPQFEEELTRAVVDLRGGPLGTYRQAQRLLRAVVADGASYNDMLINNIFEIGKNVIVILLLVKIGSKLIGQRMTGFFSENGNKLSWGSKIMQFDRVYIIRITASTVAGALIAVIAAYLSEPKKWLLGSFSGWLWNEVTTDIYLPVLGAITGAALFIVFGYRRTSGGA